MFKFLDDFKLKRNYLKLYEHSLQLTQKITTEENPLIKERYELDNETICKTLTLIASTFNSTVSSSDMWKLNKAPLQEGRVYYTSFNSEAIILAGDYIRSVYANPLRSLRENEEYKRHSREVDALQPYIRKALIEKAHKLVTEEYASVTDIKPILGSDTIFIYSLIKYITQNNNQVIHLSKVLDEKILSQIAKQTNCNILLQKD